MNLMNQVTTPETSRALITAGMPVPEPEAGQLWYRQGLNEPFLLIRSEGDGFSTFLCLADNRIYDMVLHKGYSPAFSAPEIMAWAGVKIGWVSMMVAGGLPEYRAVCGDYGFIVIINPSSPHTAHPNPAEAVAQAVLKLIGDGK